MRKKIALLANGWSSQFLQEAGRGIHEIALREDADVFAFVNYSAHSDSNVNKIGEFSILTLPDIKSFDGLIVFGSTFNMQMEFDYVTQLIEESHIPAISLEYELNGADYIGSDDYSGMYELANHLIDEHKAKDIVYIGGIKDHVGTIIRMNALLDAAESHGITIPDENILYGNFAARPAILGLEKWIQDHNRVPDAVVCANDIMAIGVCDWLKTNDYNVPGDVMVTGFDCLEVAMNHEPSIASVKREWYTMGKLSMERILKKISGETVNPYEELGARFVKGESCGCAEEYYGRSRHQYSNPLDGFECDQHFRHMYLAMRKISTKEQFNENMSHFFKNEGWLEGNNVLLAFHPSFFFSEDLSKVINNTFPQEINVLCCVNNGDSKPIFKADKQDAIFELSKGKDYAGIYICVTIRVDDIPLGFATLSADFSIFKNDVLYLWTRHMSEYAEQIELNVTINKLNERLEALSVTDALTGVYNRTGCEVVMYPELEKNQQTGGRSVVMLADLDHLKYINDTFGHTYGDTAIQTAVKILRKSLSDNYRIGRYGGDEFFISGIENEVVDVGTILQRIEENMASAAEENSLPFELSMSIGAFQLDEGQTFEADPCIQKADALMYEIKDIHHQRMDEKINK